MPLIDAARAQDFAQQWLAAWNRHDLEAVLSHYAEDLEFSSPLIAELTGESRGTLHGKAAVRAYWQRGLESLPNLHFELLDVLCGVDQLTLYYRRHPGTVAECCHFDGEGLVIRGTASYTAAPNCAVPPAPPALDSAAVPARTTSLYPTETLRNSVVGRSKQALGDALSLENFGVNRVTLAPGGVSALRHWHTRQDEFICVLQGVITLVTERGEQPLGPGMCAGFPAGKPDGHQLINRSNQTAAYLEVGDRLPGDAAHYPDHDLIARAVRGAYAFQRKDGSSY